MCDKRKKVIERQGTCPVCQCDMLRYGTSSVEDDVLCYDWVCDKCKAEGQEVYTLTFSEHFISKR